ncbi:transcriptional regulator [Enterovibrio norvegicus]|uniref:transcriptional regulator n=1 Tax=Enterovibrio norvegicus TaxID=188144 RepID=UPI000C85FA3E|nr:transcriptional regulator [Enterovibrio norvegicus]
MQTSTSLHPDDALIVEEGTSITERAITLLGEHNIYPDELQQKMLATHIKAMVWRSQSGETLPELELEMFEEISALSLTLAEQTCSWLHNLAYEEAHLLSVHFEVAKENELSTAKGE